MLAGTEPIATAFADQCSQYSAYPDLVLNSFLYRVMSGDGYVRVDQICWQ